MLSNSKPKNLNENIDKTEQLKLNLLNLKLNTDQLLFKSKTIIPFRSRAQKLRPPFNACKCLITFRPNQINLNKDEELMIEDNSSLNWKLINKNGQNIIAPSVCFALVPNTIEFNDLISKLNKRCDDLFKEAQNCQRQFKKDKLFGLMNTIKTCELEEVISFEFLLKEHLIVNFKEPQF